MLEDMCDAPGTFDCVIIPLGWCLSLTRYTCSLKAPVLELCSSKTTLSDAVAAQLKCCLQPGGVSGVGSKMQTHSPRKERQVLKSATILAKDALSAIPELTGLHSGSCWYHRSHTAHCRPLKSNLYLFAIKFYQYRTVYSGVRFC